MMPNIGKIVADALLCELRDPKKATSEHLSSIGGHFSWDETTEEEKKNGLKIQAVNDPAESSFGGLTEELSKYGRIKLTYAGGVDQVRRNGDMFRAIGKGMYC